MSQLDRAAVEMLYQRYGPMIRRRIRRFYRNPEEVDDVLQEVFVRALDKLDTFRGEAKASTWLFALTTRHCLNRVRDSRRRQELWEEQGQAVFWSQEVTESTVEGRVLLAQLLDGLDEQLLFIGTLYYVDDLSHSQIAELVGVSRRTVGNRLSELQQLARARAGEG